MLLAALDSISAQNWHDVEIIVVDGGSTDGTFKSIAQRSDIIFVPGPDKGVYDAFNKGIAKATGDIVGILNSDDLYETGAFKAVANAFAINPHAMAVCGTAILESATGIEAEFNADDDKTISSPRTTLLGSCIINARFMRRAAVGSNGLFDLQFRLVSDRDWLTRWYESELATVSIPNLVYRYRQHADSLTFDSAGKRRSAIYQELLALAQRWRSNDTASDDTRHIASLLEGRCRSRLAIIALQQGHLDKAVRLLAFDDKDVSISPLISILRAIVDRLGDKDPTRWQH